ncbi:hypothetical protein niasHS_008202 [Heterodera schachtii]|uniref:MULE transposase domain-containing protein n=1 Tax=Heterodera schachtii TaxID=97005 RepID=A0ABD2J810_HETSC
MHKNERYENSFVFCNQKWLLYDLKKRNPTVAKFSFLDLGSNMLMRATLESSKAGNTGNAQNVPLTVLGELVFKWRGTSMQMEVVTRWVACQPTTTMPQFLANSIQANEQIRQEARSDFPTTSRNIVRNVRAELPVDVRVNAPSAVNMRNNFNITKRKHHEEVGDVGLDALPIENIVIPNALQNRVIFNQILNGHRMIVFCSAHALEILRQYNTECAIDGTFESCPRGFAQLYTMSAIIDHCSVPCVYELLPNKEAATYVRFFETIRDSIGNNWSPQRLMSDFEAADIHSARIVFPNAIQNGCLFHFGQAIYRRIQRLQNLHTQYLQEIEFQRSIRSGLGRYYK